MMLFDEPTSALDPEMVGEVLELMKELSLIHIFSDVTPASCGVCAGSVGRSSFSTGGTV